MTKYLRNSTHTGFTNNGTAISAQKYDETISELYDESAIRVESMQGLLFASNPSDLADGACYLVQDFYSDATGGGDPWFWFANGDKANHDGIKTVDPTHSTTPGQSGWWTSENTGNTGVFKRWDKGYIRLKDAGAKGDGSTDDTNAIQAALDLGINIEGAPSTYKVTSITSSSSNVIIDLNGGSLVTDQINLMELDSCDNVEFRNITFKVNTSQDSEDFLGVVHYRDIDITDITFRNCTFSAPNANTNGIKFISESTFVNEDIFFYDCDFEDIGRMALECQNNVGDNTDRFKNVHIKDCKFKNTGISGSFGIGISLTNNGYGAIIDNCTFEDIENTGIESGWSGTEITNNTFYPSSRVYKPFALDGPSGDFMTSCIVQGNRTIKGDEGGTAYGSVGSECFIINVVDAIIASNNIFTDTGIKLDNVTESKFDGNFLKANNSNVLRLENGSQHNRFYNNTIDGNNISTAEAIVKFDGASVTGNIFRYTSMEKGGSAKYAENLNGASGNFMFNTDNLDDSKTINQIVDITLSDADFDTTTEQYSIILPEIYRIGGTNTSGVLLTLPSAQHRAMVINETSNTIRFRNDGNNGDRMGANERGIITYNNFNWFYWGCNDPV